MNSLGKIIVTCLLFLSVSICTATSIDTDSIVTQNQDIENKALFANEGQLSAFFEKLKDLETNRNRKLNIVHIGDSHIQAGFFTQSIRSMLQNQFGDGGIGFSFPYQLVRTNGPRDIQYSSNIAWASTPNTRAIGDTEVGIGGFALSTTTKNFALQLTSESQSINKIKIIFPTQTPQFRLSLTADKLKVTSVVSSGGKTHRIKSGETLSTIARKYGVTVAKLKQANNMRSDLIRAGKLLKIPTKNTVQVSNIKIDDNIEFTEMENHPYHSFYYNPQGIDRATFFPIEQISKYTINGFVVENNKPGIIYHSIGVNGAHMSDYNKYPVFFKQLPILEPDLVIISIGTNESFARMAVSEYMNQMNDFVNQIRKSVPNATILVMTPPASLFRRRNNNNYLIEYSEALNSQKNYTVWDLFNNMGGLQSIRSGRFASLVARDKVHYTQSGYDLQGQMFASDLLKSYTNYKEQH